LRIDSSQATWIAAFRASYEHLTTHTICTYVVDRRDNPGLSEHKHFSFPAQNEETRTYQKSWEKHSLDTSAIFIEETAFVVFVGDQETLSLFECPYLFFVYLEYLVAYNKRRHLHDFAGTH
jgi:hypothetical protein